MLRKRTSLGKELLKVSNWLCDTKLSLHLDKSECIVFGTRQKLRGLTNFSVKYNKTMTQEKCSVNYLGCELTQCMTGQTMALSVIGKVHLKTKYLARISKLLEFTP